MGGLPHAEKCLVFSLSCENDVATSCCSGRDWCACVPSAVVAVPAGQITEEVVVEESKPLTPRKRKLEQVTSHVEPKQKV